MLRTGFKQIGEEDLAVTIEADFNHPGFLNRFAAAMFALGWSILEGDISTRDDDSVFDTFRIRPVKNSADRAGRMQRSYELSQIVEAVLAEKVSGEEIMREYKVASYQERRKSSAFNDTEILFEDKYELDGVHYYFETSDRAGLLYAITSVFAENEIDIRSARIRTNAANGRAEDWFLVRHKEKTFFADMPLAGKLRMEILNLL